MKFKQEQFFKKCTFLFLAVIVLLACNNNSKKKSGDESKVAEYNIENINLRRNPLPYPPSVDTLPLKDTLIINHMIDSLFAERDSLQTRLLFASTEGINSEIKVKKIAMLEKSFDLNTDKIVKLQMEESLCGNDDSQPVESYDGKLGVTKAFVEKMSRSVGQLQWKYNFEARFNGPNDS